MIVRGGSGRAGARGSKASPPEPQSPNYAACTFPLPPSCTLHSPLAAMTNLLVWDEVRVEGSEGVEGRGGRREAGLQDEGTLGLALLRQPTHLLIIYCTAYGLVFVLGLV